MKASEIVVGGKYLGKVGERVVVVEVLARNAYGWHVKSLLTGHETRYRSAQKFRRAATEADLAANDRQKDGERFVASTIVAGQTRKLTRLGRQYVLRVDGEVVGKFPSKKAAEAWTPSTAAKTVAAKAARRSTTSGPAANTDAAAEAFRASGAELAAMVAEGDRTIAAAAQSELDRRKAKRAAKREGATA